MATQSWKCIGHCCGKATQALLAAGETSSYGLAEGAWPHAAQFVPPHHNQALALMDDLTTFANRLDLAALVQIAVAHAQFETIHPFPDGNGRVGRALIPVMLRGGRLTRNVAAPVSTGLPHGTGHYCEALGACRGEGIAPIVQSFAGASFAAVYNGRMLAGDLDAVNSEWRERVKARRDSSAHRLLGILNQISTGKRNRIWLAKDVVRVLDDIGARARRRT